MEKKFLILGIECTAHTFGIGLVSDGKILSNVRDMYKPEKGGIIPMDSAKHHREVAEIVYERAIEDAGISISDISAIAVSNAPGLAPCLLAGVEFAKKKALELKVPLIPVNHCIAHLEIGQHEGAKDPVLLYASGANTQIIAFSAGKYRVFGETLDSGIGNFIDTLARYMGIAFPGGPEIEKKAKQAVSKENLIELPYSIKGMDVSFSGMQTKLKQLYDNGHKIEDLSYSMQEHAFAMLVEAAERALAHTQKSELVLGGGVACNRRLQEMCRIMCNERGAKYFCPPNDLLVDNAAMIAFTGELMYNAMSRPLTHGKSKKIIDNKKKINRKVKRYFGKLTNNDGVIDNRLMKKIIDGKNKMIVGDEGDGRINYGDSAHKNKSINNKISEEWKPENIDIAPRERTDEVDVFWR